MNEYSTLPCPACGEIGLRSDDLLVRPIGNTPQSEAFFFKCGACGHIFPECPGHPALQVPCLMHDGRALCWDGSEWKPCENGQPYAIEP